MTALIVDDDATLREMLQQSFGLESIPVEVVSDPRSVLSKISRDFDGVVISDVRMPVISGIELLRLIHAIDDQIPVIIMTGHGDVPMVIDAMRSGVFDFITKPFSTEHLLASVRRARELRTLVIENRSLRAVASEPDIDEILIGKTPVIVNLRNTIRQLAQADADVLIEGETGTGKELVAMLLHKWGPRRRKRLVTLNCAALPEQIAESELLGVEAGVSIHSKWGRAGLIEASDGGTLFLDETGSMPASVQGAFLRIVEQREVLRLGSDAPRALNLRFVASTNVDLAEAVTAGIFRKDLYYRLNQVRLRVPPLRERVADIPLLFYHFLDEASKRFNLNIPDLPHSVHAYLHTHNWPGNVRELRNFAQSAVLDPNQSAIGNALTQLSLAAQVAAFEAAAIRISLEKAEGDVNKVHTMLDLARNTLYDKMKRYGIRPVDYKSF